MGFREKNFPKPNRQRASALERGGRVRGTQGRTATPLSIRRDASSNAKTMSHPACPVSTGLYSVLCALLRLITARNSRPGTRAHSDARQETQVQARSSESPVTASARQTPAPTARHPSAQANGLETPTSSLISPCRPYGTWQYPGGDPNYNHVVPTGLEEFRSIEHVPVLNLPVMGVKGA